MSTKRTITLPILFVLLLSLTACSGGQNAVPAAETAQPVSTTQAPAAEPTNTAAPPANTATAVPTEEPTATQPAATPTPDIPRPILGQQPVFSGLAAAIVDGFQPGETVAVTLENADAILSTEQFPADPRGRVLIARWISGGLTDPLPAGTYTYTLTGGAQTQTVTFEVTEKPDALPAYAQAESVSCQVTPDDPGVDEYAILWCWGGPVPADGFVTLRISDGTVTQEIPNKAVDHLAVYPLQLTLDGMQPGTHTYTLLIEGQPAAALTLEIR